MRTNVQVDNIPDSIKAQHRWCVWVYEPRKTGGKPTKIPKQPDMWPAKSNDPATFCSFEEAMKSWKTNERVAGIGYFIPEGLVGVDLDDCIDKVTGKRDDSLDMLLSMFNTYAEVSPSGTGVKMLCTGNVATSLPNICHKRGVEIYEGGKTNRFFTVTGNRVDEGHDDIRGCADALHNLQSMISLPIGDRHILRDSELTDELDESDRELAVEFLKHLPEDMTEGYHTWTMVGMALHHVDPSPEMCEEWDDWSRQSGSYEEGACETKWESFGKNMHINMVGLPYLKKCALENGFNPDVWQPMAIDAVDFMKKEISHNYIVDDLLVEGQCMTIAGASKTLKTSIALDLALSISTGQRFLNHFEVLSQRNVFVISGESGDATIQRTLDTIYASKGIDIHTDEAITKYRGGLFVSFNLPKLRQKDDQVALVRFLAENEINVVVIDPLYMSLDAGADSSNVYEMGHIIGPMLRRFANAGVTPILLHHFRKQGDSFDKAPALEEITGAGAAEATRQWLLLKRKSLYRSDGQHDLWMNHGGSAGHTGDGVASIHAGTNRTGLRWDAQYLTHDQFAAEAAKRKVAEDLIRMERIAQACLQTLLAYPEGMSLTLMFKHIKARCPDADPSKADVDDALHTLEENNQCYKVVKGSKTTFFADELTASLI